MMKATESAITVTNHYEMRVKEEIAEFSANYEPLELPKTENQDTITMTVPANGRCTNALITTAINTNSGPNNSNHLPPMGSNSSTNEATSPTGTHQNSSAICQVLSSTKSVHHGIGTGNLKPKNESPPPPSTQTPNERHPEPLSKERAHPSALNGQGQYSGHLLGSSGDESPSSSHSVEPEDESDGGKHREPTSVARQISSANSNKNGRVSNDNLRCIFSIFGSHAKLRRLLGTLMLFANNMSTGTGDTVRNLVLQLLSGGMTAEEFHIALQEATNFPLHDFVLPYLKHTLPSLRQNLNAAARANDQTCVQYLRTNESAVLETMSLTPCSETAEIFGDNTISGSPSNPTNYNVRSSIDSIQHSNAGNSTMHHYTGATNLATKRRTSDTPSYENSNEEPSIYGKRNNNSAWNHHGHHQHQSDPYCWYHPLNLSGNTTQGHTQSHVPPSLVQANQFSSFGPGHPPPLPQQINHFPGQIQNGSSLDDEWKNINVMLNCILGMVEKTKRALAILQRRGCSSPAAATPAPGLAFTQNGTSNGNNLSTTNSSRIESSNTGDRDGNLKRLSGEIVAQTIRATEDRVAAEVKRRAEEAVQEVKRAAMAEVHRAVAAAVAKSRTSERLKARQLLDHPLAQRTHHSIRQGSFPRLGSQASTESTKSPPSGDDEKDSIHLDVVGSSCWNCGRPALETCGGCGIARYCGSFCQHRDWEIGGHHATCNTNSIQESRRSSSRSPPRVGNNTLTTKNEVNSAASNIAKGK